MEAARTSETLVNFYQTTRCYNPEDSNLHTHRRENLKSYKRIEVRIVSNRGFKSYRTWMHTYTVNYCLSQAPDNTILVNRTDN
jgi:hypothetical protein